jgi:hypothetical protein
LGLAAAVQREVRKMVFEETEQEDIPTIIDSGRLVVGSRSDCLSLPLAD